MMSVAKALIYDAEDNVLVLRRSASHPHYALEADLPGGMTEDGENPLAAVIREIKEEISLHVEETSVLFAHKRITANNRHDSVYTLKLNTVKPTIKLSWEHESYEWVPVNDIVSKLKTKDDYMTVVFELLAAKL